MIGRVLPPDPSDGRPFPPEPSVEERLVRLVCLNPDCVTYGWRRQFVARRLGEGIEARAVPCCLYCRTDLWRITDADRERP